MKLTPEEQRKRDDFAVAFAFIIRAKTTDLVRFGEYYVTNRGDIFTVKENLSYFGKLTIEITKKADEYTKNSSYADLRKEVPHYMYSYDLADAHCLSWKRAKRTNKNDADYQQELKRRYDFQRPLGVIIVPVTYLPDIANDLGNRPQIVVSDSCSGYILVSDEYEDIEYRDGVTVYIRTYQPYIKAFGYIASVKDDVLRQWHSFVHVLEQAKYGLLERPYSELISHILNGLYDDTTFIPQIPVDDLLDKVFCPALLNSPLATHKLREVVSGKIKKEVCGRGKKNNENWTWAHVRRAMVRSGFFGPCPEKKTPEYWEDNALSGTAFGHAINSCDSSIKHTSVKTQCDNHKNKHDTCDDNIVNRICDYLKPIADLL